VEGGVTESASGNDVPVDVCLSGCIHLLGNDKMKANGNVAASFRTVSAIL
jgi:hypothetical protein